MSGDGPPVLLRETVPSEGARISERERIFDWMRETVSDGVIVFLGEWGLLLC